MNITTDIEVPQNKEIRQNLDILKHKELLEIKEAWEKVYSSIDLEKLPWENTHFPTEILNEYIRYIKEKNNPRVLDFGCGSGRIAKYLIEKGIAVDLYDISDEIINKLKLQSELNDKTEFYSGFGFSEKKYDGIICWGVFHHIPPHFWNIYIDYLFTHLQEGGYILFGDFTKKDKNFADKISYLSPTTKRNVYPVKFNLLEDKGRILNKNFFAFQENKNFLSGSERKMEYVICKHEQK